MGMSGVIGDPTPTLSGHFLQKSGVGGRCFCATFGLHLLLKVGYQWVGPILYAQKGDNSEYIL